MEPHMHFAVWNTRTAFWQMAPGCIGAAFQARFRSSRASERGRAAASASPQWNPAVRAATTAQPAYRSNNCSSCTEALEMTHPLISSREGA
jgi:hypothetical protein